MHEHTNFFIIFALELINVHLGHKKSRRAFISPLHKELGVQIYGFLP